MSDPVKITFDSACGEGLKIAGFFMLECLHNIAVDDELTAAIFVSVALCTM